MAGGKVYRLKNDVVVAGAQLKAKQELEIVMDVVYMNGFMLPPNLQPAFLNWIKQNPSLFEDDTRNW